MAAPAHQRARRRFADRLREARIATGLNGAEFAQRLGWGQSTVSRFETGARLPSAEQVDAWAAATGVDLGELRELFERARTEYGTFRDRFAAAGGADRFQEQLGAAEAGAVRLGQWQPAVVIGLCQTAGYAGALLRGASGPAAFGVGEEEIGRIVAARVRRQAVLYEPGRQVTMLMGEAALRIQVAPVEVMRGQLAHLAELALLGTSTVGIVPFSARMPVLPLSGFALEDDVVSIETLGGLIELADPAEVATYERWLGLLREAAATGAAAADLCARVARDL